MLRRMHHRPAVHPNLLRVRMPYMQKIPLTILEGPKLILIILAIIFITSIPNKATHNILSFPVAVLSTHDLSENRSRIDIKIDIG